MHDVFLCEPEFPEGREGPPWFALCGPSPLSPMSPWVVGAKSVLTGLWVTQCHSGHINRRCPGCGLASASPQGVDDPFNTHVPAVTHSTLSTQYSPPTPGSLKIPPGLTCGAPGRGARAFWGCDPCYRNKALSASGEERQAESRFSFPVMMAPVIEMPNCTSSRKSLGSKNVVCDAGVSNANI